MLSTAISETLTNKVLIVSILSWATAQALKFIITYIQDGKWDFTKLVSAGGMPSSHSSFVTALTVGIGRVEGFDTPLFAACAVISFIIMYDATGVRWEAGQQAAVINRIVEILQDPDIKLETQLKEILGHTPLQVFAGIILGITFGVICF
ncbi:MAG: divergent PAP2 family protein [Epulopiscium sp.]|nr:divergent PAP2 family protein [Candidatus Epulonipiscium sp.]